MRPLTKLSKEYYAVALGVTAAGVGENNAAALTPSGSSRALMLRTLMLSCSAPRVLPPSLPTPRVQRCVGRCVAERPSAGDGR